MTRRCRFGEDVPGEQKSPLDPDDRIARWVAGSVARVTAVDAMFWVVCLVLVVAGASKVSRPDLVAPTFTALLRGRDAHERAGRSGELTSGVRFARTSGIVEVVVGVVALTVGGGVVAVVVAVLYVVFAVVVVMARRRGLASCGCFGARSAAPSWVHVAVDVASAALAIGAAAVAGGPEPVADGLSQLGGPLAVVVAVAVLVATVLVVVLDTAVADAVESARSNRGVRSGAGGATRGDARSEPEPGRDRERGAVR